MIGNFIQLSSPHIFFLSILFYFLFNFFYLLKCNNERERDLSLKLNAIIMCFFLYMNVACRSRRCRIVIKSERVAVSGAVTAAEQKKKE